MRETVLDLIIWWHAAGLLVAALVLLVLGVAGTASIFMELKRRNNLLRALRAFRDDLEEREP